MNNNPILANTGNDEWCTPSKFIELARKVMGSIDTDPASNDFAQQTVQATTYYTYFDNGLDKPWYGKVWLNPPYSRGNLKKFSEKLIWEFKYGDCDEAIVLTSASTDTRWFHELSKVASAICLTRGRIKFIRLDGSIGKSPTSGHAFFYLGPNVNAFRNHFSPVGLVHVPAPLSFL